MSRRHAVRAVGILTALALVFGVFAGAASARTHSRHMSRHQKAVIRRDLMRSVKKNPRVIRKASFLRKASLVNFQLPVTIRLRTNVPCEGNPQPGTIAAGGCSPTSANAHIDPSNTGSPTFPNYVYNPNVASIDLGPSLGSREIDLGGTLPALIKFHDSFDGGALGNVDLSILSTTQANAYASGWGSGTGLTSTSIPLLWNNQVSASTSQWYLSGGDQNAGCGNFTNTAQSGLNPYNGVVGYPAAGNVPGGAEAGAPWSAISSTGFANAPVGSNLATGFSLQTPVSSAGEIAALGGSLGDPVDGVPYVNGLGGLSLVPEYPGIDQIQNILAGSVAPNPLLSPFGDPRNAVSVNDIIGGNPNPFPGGGGPVGGGYSNPNNNPSTVGYGNAQDTVLRTGALKLSVADAGTSVSVPTGPPSGSTIVVGQSGGQANLFGNIPGKSSGVDVTVSLGTKINSILREVDPDPQTLVQGQNWTAQAFACRQAWTGYVQNYIPGVHLTGQLRISPAIDRDGSLRIAKTILSSPAGEADNIALAACLAPYVTYAKPDHGTTPDLPGGTAAQVPVDPIQENAYYASGYAADNAVLGTTQCNAPPSAQVAAAGVTQLQPTNGAQTNGSQVDVAGALTVSNIDAEVLVGALTNPAPAN